MKNGSITKLGKILRNTGIDELPQLINIFKQDLNFIGPRPLTESDIKRLAWQSDHYKCRWTVKPGLTGLAQISPICHKKISFFWDKYYIDHKSFLLDIRIIFASMLVPILGKKRAKNILIVRKK